MIAWLFDTTGIGWIVILTFIFLRLLDKMTVRPIENFLDAEHYPGLIAKYRDPDRIKYQAERAWAYNNFGEYLGRAMKEQGIRTWWLLIKARWHYDYKTMYNLMQDLDEEGEPAQYIK